MSPNAWGGLILVLILTPFLIHSFRDWLEQRRWSRARRAMLDSTDEAFRSLTEYLDERICGKDLGGPNDPQCTRPKGHSGWCSYTPSDWDLGEHAHDD
jgi:hypothetical protein